MNNICYRMQKDTNCATTNRSPYAIHAGRYATHGSHIDSEDSTTGYVWQAFWSRLLLARVLCRLLRNATH